MSVIPLNPNQTKSFDKRLDDVEADMLTLQEDYNNSKADYGPYDERLKTAEENSSNALDVAQHAQDRVDNIITEQDGKAPVELIDARHDNINNKNYVNIGARLDEHATQLNEKAKQVDLNATNAIVSLKADKNDVAKISSGTPLFASSVSGMTDITRNYVNTADGYLYIYSGGVWTKTTVQYQSTGIATNSVAATKVSSSDTITKNDVSFTSGQYTTVGGALNYGDPNAIHTEPIPVLPNTTYEYRSLNAVDSTWWFGCALLDENQSVISVQSGGTPIRTITTTANTRYIVINTNKNMLDYFYLKIGATKKLKWLMVDDENLGSFQVSEQRLLDDSVTKKKIANDAVIKEKVNSSAKIVATDISTNDGYIFNTSGKTAAPGYSYTDFIPVIEGRVYELHSKYSDTQGMYFPVAFFSTNSESGFMSAISANTLIDLNVTIPTGCKYIVCNLYNTYKSEFYFNNKCVKALDWLKVTRDNLDIYLTTLLSSITASQNLKLNGLKWNTLGDSITAGVGASKKYYEYVSDRQGGMTVSNFGIAGTRIADDGVNQYGQPMCVRYSSMGTASLITVLGGINDWGQQNPTPLGAMGDTVKTTFYGALDTLCKGLQSKYPTALIVFMTPTRANGFNGYFIDGANSLGLKLDDYVKAIKDVCGKYAIPVVDLFTQSGFSVLNATQNPVYFADNLHWTNKGHEKVSYLIEDMLMKCYVSGT